MLLAVGDSLEVLTNDMLPFWIAEPLWQHGRVVDVGLHKGKLTYWARLRLPASDAMATLPYTDDDFLAGIIRVTRDEF